VIITSNEAAAYNLGVTDGARGYSERDVFAGYPNLLNSYDEGYSAAAGPILASPPEAPDQVVPLSAEDAERDKQAQENEELRQKAVEKAADINKELSQRNPRRSTRRTQRRPTDYVVRGAGQTMEGLPHHSRR
jgi:hypothetical protein